MYTAQTFPCILRKSRFAASMKVFFLGMGLLAGGLRAQYAFELNTLTGSVLAHSKYNQNLNARKSLGMQASAIWLLPPDTGLHWQRSETHRFVGFSLVAMDLGDGPLNGNSATRKSLVPMGNGVSALAITGAKKAIQPLLGFSALQIQWGFGLMHLSKYYDSINNPMNIAMSSRMNFAAQLKAQAVNHLSPHSSLTLGLEMFHTSNANWQKPNVGLNYAQLSLGWSYRLHSDKHITKDPCYWRGDAVKQLSVPYQFSLRYAHRKYLRTYPIYYPIYIADVNWGLPNKYQSNNTTSKENAKNPGTSPSTVGMPKGEWRFGANVFFEQGQQKGMSDGTLLSIQNRWEIGIYGRRVMRFGPLDIFMDFGLYALPPKADRVKDLEKTRWFYNAIGTQYRINHHWMFIHRLKAHYHVADYMEIGVLYQF